MSRKIRVIALIAAFALMLSGCSLFTVDEDLVNAQTVASVNGKAITRSQVEQTLLSSQSFMYEMYYYGVTYEDFKKDDKAKAWYVENLNYTLDRLVEEELLRLKAAEMGIALTDEEKAEKREEADAEFQYAKEQIRSEVEQEFGLIDENGEQTGAEADEAAIDAEVEKRYQEFLGTSDFTPDMYYEQLYNQALVAKVTDYVKGLAEVTDEDVRKWYDDTLAVQQPQMDETPTVFADNMNKNLINTYVPEDTYALKHVLIKYKDEDLTEVATELYTGGKEAEAMELLKGEIEALTPAMLEVKQRLEAGESIDELIKELGEDPGMASGTTAATGYIVGESTTTYVKEFKDAALKLTSVGQISGPVATYYGLHVLQNIKTYKKGIIPFEDLKDSIKTALLPGRQTAKYKDTLEQWKSEANITYDRARLEN